MERDPRRRRGAIIILLLLPALAILLAGGRLEALSAQQGLLLIEAGEDADGVHASVETVNGRTRVLVTGFTGTPTSYSELLRVCNAGPQRLAIRLEVVRVVEGGWAPKVLTAWLLGTGGGRRLLLSPPLLTVSAPIELDPGECARIGVEVLIPATARAGETLTITIGFAGV